VVPSAANDRLANPALLIDAISVPARHGEQASPRSADRHIGVAEAARACAFGSMVWPSSTT
jgi:hypothetical protein